MDKVTQGKAEEIFKRLAVLEFEFEALGGPDGNSKVMLTWSSLPERIRCEIRDELRNRLDVLINETRAELDAL